MRAYLDTVTLESDDTDTNGSSSDSASDSDQLEDPTVEQQPTPLYPNPLSPPFTQAPRPTLSLSPTTIGSRNVSELDQPEPEQLPVKKCVHLRVRSLPEPVEPELDEGEGSQSDDEPHEFEPEEGCGVGVGAAMDEIQDFKEQEEDDQVSDSSLIYYNDYDE